MIYIIRHGKTELNRLKVLQGRSNSPLNEEGIRQAERAAKMLQGIEFAHVFSSPLIRAVQTAEIVAPGKEITIDHRLIEMDYGPYEGTDLNHLPPEIITFFSDFVNNPAPDGMEPLESVVSRTDVFLEEIRNLEGNILVSTHAIAMKGILECLTPESHGAYWSKYIGNCSVYAAENADQTIGIPAEIVFPDPWAYHGKDCEWAMMKTAVEAAMEYVQILFRNNSGGHDADHTMRVYRNALLIAGHEADCDIETVSLASLLHASS